MTDERPGFYGKLRRFHEVVCFDCGEAQLLEARTVREASAEARSQYDWALGRDGNWRCPECRPTRFGERRR